MGSCIKPGISAPHLFYMQLPTFQIRIVDIGNFKLTTRRWFYGSCDFNDLRVIEIHPGHGIIRFRLFRLFFNSLCHSLVIEFDDTVTFRVLHIIGKNRCAGGLLHRVDQKLGQAMPEKYVIPQNQTARVIADKCSPDPKRIGKTAGLFLNGIFDLKPPPLTITQQLTK